MKIEPFEIINCENQNLNINNNTKISEMKTSSIKNLLLQILTPDTLSTLSNFILPMLNKKENNKNDDMVVETNQYKEIKNNENEETNTINNAENSLKNKDFPTINPQLDFSNIIHKAQEEKSKEVKQNLYQNNNQAFIKYDYNIRQKITQNKIEEHRRNMNILNQRR